MDPVSDLAISLSCEVEKLKSMLERERKFVRNYSFFVVIFLIVLCFTIGFRYGTRYGYNKAINDYSQGILKIDQK